MIVICRLWTVASSQNHQSFESQDVLMQGRYVLNPNKGMNIHESQGFVTIINFQLRREVNGSEQIPRGSD